MVFHRLCPCNINSRDAVKYSKNFGTIFKVPVWGRSVIFLDTAIICDLGMLWVIVLAKSLKLHKPSSALSELTHKPHKSQDLIFPFFLTEIVTYYPWNRSGSHFTFTSDLWHATSFSWLLWICTSHWWHKYQIQRTSKQYEVSLWICKILVLSRNLNEARLTRLLNAMC